MNVNGSGVKGHLGVNDLWFKFLQKQSLYPHTLMYVQARLVVPEPPCYLILSLSTPYIFCSTPLVWNPAYASDVACDLHMLHYTQDLTLREKAWVLSLFAEADDSVDFNVSN